jgi:cyclohexadieny/prephenate dehydrogenase
VTQPFRRLAVLGLGLLGGSVAIAARRRGLAARVAGGARRAEVRALALEREFVDEATDFEAAVAGADLVVLATPVFAMPDLVRRIAPALAPGAIVTDVGSVKRLLVEVLPGLLPAGSVYVGSHPMAGSHRSGIEHAREDLFEGAACVVTEAPDAALRERVCGFWRALGARVVLRDAASHDAEVAWMSHLPHAMAFAFAAALGRAPARAFEVAGAGFRDFTRIAHSEPELWADILVSNRKALAAPLQVAGQALAELSRAIEANDVEALERCIGAARDALSRAEVRGSDRSADDDPNPRRPQWPGGARRTSRT